LYDVLSRLRIPCHASGTPGTLMRPPLSQPVLQHDENGRLVQVRWNNEDRGVLGQGWQAEDVGAWYRAARIFEELSRAPDAEYWVQLSPGTMVGECAFNPHPLTLPVIDNWRVMHGRSAFSGSRRMCGAYVGADDWRSRRAALRNGKLDHWQVGW
jgi:trimethyllysine dioxygenase